MRWLALALLAACASRPSSSAKPRAVAAPPAVTADASAPSAPTWSHEPEIMLPMVESNVFHQTKTHIVWEETLANPKNREDVAVVVLDKKTLVQRTAHVGPATGVRFLWTTDDAIFIDRDDDLVRITLDSKAPIHIPGTDDVECADAASLYRVHASKKVSVVPIRAGGGKPLTFPIEIPSASVVTSCVRIGDALGLFLRVREEPKEWGEPREHLGRVPMHGGAFEMLGGIDGAGTMAVASDGALVVRSLPRADPMRSHISILEPGKRLRVFQVAANQSYRIAINRTHICWDDVPETSRTKILCVPRAGGEPEVVVDPTQGFFMLDDEHLMFINGPLLRLPVPR